MRRAHGNTHVARSVRWREPVSSGNRSQLFQGAQVWIMFSQRWSGRKTGSVSAWSCTSSPLKVVKQISNRKESILLLCLAELQLANTESVLLQNPAQLARIGNKDLALHTWRWGGDQEGEEQWGGVSSEKELIIWAAGIRSQSSERLLMAGVCGIMVEQVVMARDTWTRPQGKTGINSSSISLILRYILLC